MNHWIILIFVAIFGSIIGSFLNVVIYRVPRGLSIFSPSRSFCPNCNTELAWYDNVPIFGWFMLNGRCRYCKNHISFQYPLIETICTVLFASLFIVYFMTTLRLDMSNPGFQLTWPVFAVHLLLLAAMLASTVIDAQMYIIPLTIPWVATVVAMVVLPVAASRIPEIRPVVPLVDRAIFGAAIGGAIGLVIANTLLQMGYLPLSFAEEPREEMKDKKTDGDGEKNKTDSPHAQDHQAAVGPLVPELPDDFYVHPNPRGEILKEALFLTPVVIGMLIGWKLIPIMFPPAMPGQPLSLGFAVLGGVFWGYLVGGGLIWGTRIFGTLAFGKEAMGLGDVHFLAAIGAAIGAQDATLVFFIAPFLGLAYAAVTALQRMIRGEVRVIPYGPYLAIASFLVMILRTPIRHKLGF